jgi:DNA repair protein RecO (recombination protein O)
MIMQRFESQAAYLLHARPYRETSLLLELFIEDLGRITVIGKGVRLQLFVPLCVSCVGRGELLTLTDVDSGGMAPVLKGRALVSAFYINELLMRLLHRWDPYPELFTQYQSALQILSESDQEQVALRLFEKALLKSLGYELQLLKDAETGLAVQPENYYSFNPAVGPRAVDLPSPYVFKGKSLLGLAEGYLNDISILSDAKRLMRLALAPHLGSKPLESRKLL